MEQIKQNLLQMLENGCEHIVVSKPSQNAEYKKIVIEKKKLYYQIEKYTEKQVFHENSEQTEIVEKLTKWLSEEYRQLNGFGGGKEFIFLISKKGKVTYRQKKTADAPKATESHNRKKNYILEEGKPIPPLVDMGIFTAEGKVVQSMYDKFRQINRFIEMIDDYIRTKSVENLNIIDFGCGKSYLTFIMYYYFTEIKKISVQMVGLDLKADVIEKCNAAAKKYGYDSLRFELGDINGYQAPFSVDMVVTLHACDTATDFALYNAICWNAGMIFSVPCCQHEWNQQMESENLKLLTRYGIIKERFAALATDAVRANLLECCGYKTQVMEFVDLSHTPKNLLLRGIKRKNITKSHKEELLAEAKALMQECQVTPTLYTLLEEKLAEEIEK